MTELPAVWATRPATTVAADNRIAGPGRSDFKQGGYPVRTAPERSK